MAHAKYSIWKCVKVGGQWGYKAAAYANNNRIRPDLVIVDGHEEAHPEGNYYLYHSGNWARPVVAVKVAEIQVPRWLKGHEDAPMQVITSAGMTWRMLSDMRSTFTASASAVTGSAVTVTSWRAAATVSTASTFAACPALTVTLEVKANVRDRDAVLADGYISNREFTLLIGNRRVAPGVESHLRALERASGAIRDMSLNSALVGLRQRQRNTEECARQKQYCRNTISMIHTRCLLSMRVTPSLKTRKSKLERSRPSKK